MSDWEQYAQRQRHGPDAYTNEPVQGRRVETIARRCVGDVLDVGCSDGWSASRYQAAGHNVTGVDISPTRIERLEDDYGIGGFVADAADLPFLAGQFDTVVLAEILEHTDNPGAALAEAFRIANERVIISLPLGGWEDPTHQWRISLDVCRDETQAATEPTKGEQIVITFQRGPCWPPGYSETDEAWQAQFGEGR